MMDAYKHMENDAFIAFKVPTALKNQLILMADQEGINLSQLLRRNCIQLAGLPKKPTARSTGRKFQKEPATGSWLGFWR